MAAISYSAFLQALGWAALNSFWQTGILWCFFLIINYLFKLSPQNKYFVSTVCIIKGFMLFLGNIVYYLAYGPNINFDFIHRELAFASNWLPAVLISASITYLILLAVPAYRLFENWRYVRLLQQQGLQKAGIEYRLFVQKTSKLIGIRKNVNLYLSEIIHSPVTIGYLKPIILLPVASLNHLTMQQAEAVLLHELAHIRRHDYLINILISLVHTFMYFNPFVKLFVRMADISREQSCDQVVLQYGYDKISYASALLNLEKASTQHYLLAIGATGKKHLLERIEKIAGLPSKRSVFNFGHLAGLIAVILLTFSLQLLFATKEDKVEGKLFTFNNFANPFYFIVNGESFQENKPDLTSKATIKGIETKVNHVKKEAVKATEENTVIENPAMERPFIPVSLNEVDLRLTAEEKKQVKSTVDLAKKVLTTYEWNKLKGSIPDGLTREEAEIAHQEYLAEVNKINWTNLEASLKADYNNIEWNKIDSTLEIIIKQDQLDSLQCKYERVITLMQAAEQKNKVDVLPFPDESIQKIQSIKLELYKKLDSIQTIQKKTIKL